MRPNSAKIMSRHYKHNNKEEISIKDSDKFENKQLQHRADSNSVIPFHQKLKVFTKRPLQLTYGGQFSRIIPKDFYQDKQRLYAEAINLKHNLNEMQDQNMRLRTKIAILQKQIQKAKRFFEGEHKSKFDNNSSYNFSIKEYSVVNLKKLLFEARQQIEILRSQNIRIKKSIKYTKLHEIEIQKRSFLQQTIRLKAYIEHNLKLDKNKNTNNYVSQLQKQVQKYKKQNIILLQKSKNYQQTKNNLNKSLYDMQILRKQLLKVNQKVQKQQGNKFKVNNNKQENIKIDTNKQKFDVRQKMLNEVKITKLKNKRKYEEQIRKNDEGFYERLKNIEKLKQIQRQKQSKTNEQKNMKNIIKKSRSKEQMNIKKVEQQIIKKQLQKNQKIQHNPQLKKAALNVQAIKQPKKIQNKQQSIKLNNMQQKNIFNKVSVVVKKQQQLMPAIQFKNSVKTQQQQQYKFQEQQQEDSKQAQLIKEIQQLLWYRFMGQGYSFKQLKNDLQRSGNQSFNIQLIKQILGEQPFLLKEDQIDTCLKIILNEEGNKKNIKNSYFIQKLRFLIGQFQPNNQQIQKSIQQQAIKNVSKNQQQLKQKINLAKNPSNNTISKASLQSILQSFLFQQNQIQFILSHLSLHSLNMQSLNYSILFAFPKYISQSQNHTQIHQPIQNNNSKQQKKKSKLFQPNDHYLMDSVDIDYLNQFSQKSFSMKGQKIQSNQIIEDYQIISDQQI